MSPNWPLSLKAQTSCAPVNRERGEARTARELEIKRIGDTASPKKHPKPVPDDIKIMSESELFAYLSTATPPPASTLTGQLNREEPFGR